jgi:hypothetical protein
MTSYSHFSLEDISNQFGILNKRQRLFDNIIEIPPSDWLNNSLSIAEELPIKSEKARSEMIVVPILVELRKLNNKYFTIYSGETLTADAEKGLKGECDFILAKDTGSFNINTPIIQVVEAKKNDVEIGIPQCAAQLIGANIYNQQRNTNLEQIYGCVTTGDIWQFLKLENNEILIDTRRYYLGNVAELLGVFQQIITYCIKSIA